MKYFHGSRKAFQTGFTLTPQPNGYAQDQEHAEFESLFEVRRPDGKLSRSASVFLVSDPEMIDNAGGYSDAIYVVKPVVTPEASDLSYYSEAFCEFTTDPRNTEQMNRMIDLYWAGDPNPDEAFSCMEYRTPAAIVQKIHELNVEPNELEKVRAACPVSNHNCQL